MNEESPNYRGYLIDVMQKTLELMRTDTNVRNCMEKFLAQADGFKNARKKGKYLGAIYAEDLMTKVVMGSADLQKYCFGLEFTGKTCIKTNNNTYDISGKCRYLYPELREKHNIREEDAIVIEVKFNYSYSGLEKEQKNSAKNGALDAVFSILGSYTDYVEGTDCPVIHFRKTKKSDDAVSIIDPDQQIWIIDFLDRNSLKYPKRYTCKKDLSDHAEQIIFVTDTNKCRNAYHVLLYMSKNIDYRMPFFNESEVDYRKRIISTVYNLMDEPQFIYGLDNHYPHGIQRWRKRHSDRKSSINFKSEKEIETEINNNLFYNLSCKNLENHLFEVKNDSKGDCYAIIFPSWIIEELKLKKVVGFALADSSYSHLMPVKIPKIFEGYSLCDKMRSRIDCLWLKICRRNSIAIDISIPKNKKMSMIKKIGQSKTYATDAKHKENKIKIKIANADKANANADNDMIFAL